MLQKFLFIGVGGSGGKTLRMVRADLERTLALRGYRKGLPEAWQFVQIDVPLEDSTSADLPPRLPPGSYVSVTPGRLSYTEVDTLIMSKGESVRRHTAMWRPDPRLLTDVVPSIGAGQYRAVGRVFGGASIGTVVTRLRAAIERLSDVSTDAEFEKIGAVLGLDDKDLKGRPEPLPVIVSSIAGGSGSGLFLDVCDALRMIKPTWGDNSVAVLFTPDTFDELSPASRAGVTPNALAAISELVSGQYNTEPPEPDEFALLESAGVAIQPIERRGPRYPILVGRSNGTISFGGQLDVYRVVAKQLVAWTLSSQIQGLTNEGIFGNWGSAAKAHPHSLPYGKDRGAPITSMGFASVDLGRDRFATYASERLGRQAIERVLRGHWTTEVREDEKTSDAAREERADQIWAAVLERCGLNERTRDHNQIVDGLRQKNRVAALTRTKSQVSESVVEGRSVIEPGTLESLITAQVKSRRAGTLDEIRASDHAGAQAWCEGVQERILDEMVEVVSAHGAEVALSVLDRMVAELREVSQELVRDSEFYASRSRGILVQLSEKIRRFGAAFGVDNPEILDNVKLACDELYLDAEAQLHLLASGIVEDLCSNFLTPLRATLSNGVKALNADVSETPTEGLAVANWANVAVPERLRPADNEILLEPLDSYPAAFEAKVVATVGVKEPVTAVSSAAEAVIRGGSPQQLLRITRRWAPQFAAIVGGSAPARAEFESAFRAADLLARSESWIETPNTAIGNFVGESLQGYLSPGAAAPDVHRDRLAAFSRGFSQALTTSLPLIAVDESALTEVYGEFELGYERVMTGLPFSEGEPARKVVTDILRGEGLEPSRIEGMFKEAQVSRIDVTTFLASPVHPTVFSSLIDPIRNELAARSSTGDLGDFWRQRRARTLSASTPVTPEERRSLVRGWFLARLLDLVEVPVGKPVTIATPDGVRAFPFPMLGAPVARMDELLPALMESLPLLVLDSSPNGVLAAYGFLIALGSPTGSTYYETSQAPDLLLTWLAGGVRPPAAPVSPSLTALTSEEQRLEYGQQFLQKFVKHFGQLENQSTKPDDLLKAPRAYEIRNDIMRSLFDLQSLLERATSAGLDPSDVG